MAKMVPKRGVTPSLNFIEKRIVTIQGTQVAWFMTEALVANHKMTSSIYVIRTAAFEGAVLTYACRSEDLDKYRPSIAATVAGMKGVT
jgi:hypothetical protein